MMPLSRRRLLGMAAALPLALPQRLAGKALMFSDGAVRPRCLLVDTGEQCVLQESLTGFARGLAALSIRFERVSAEALVCISYQGPKRAGPAQLLIIPGGVMDSHEFAKNIRRLTDSGSTVLYESGAAFAEHEAFEAEQRLLRDYFGLSEEAPRELWPAKADVTRPPYVRYHWPSQVIIRDFSRAIAVSEAASSSHIAHIGTAAVACHRPVGKGAFIFLGSPLGPHLNFGDAEAQRLLSAFVRPFTQSEIQPPIRKLLVSS